jgi:thioesterase domain-containing protein/acyl carrier protein
LPNVQLYILDKFQSPVPLGVAGELFIGGSGVGRGYVNHPDLTDEKFLPNPFSSEVGKRVYRTGDLVRYCADGMLQFVGRIDQQVKIRGYRIELSEIQTTILLHEGVQECVVLASEVSPGDKRLVAYLVLKKNHTFSISELRDFVKNTLPDYMVPTAFLTVESFPLTPNGKIDYKALPAPFTTNKRGEDFIAPRNELEAQLAKIWEELLEVNPIGINEDFFALGGHSLLSMRMLARIGSSMGKKLPVTIILQHPTIEQLAKAISTVTENDYSLLVPIQTKGTTRPLFLIHSANGNLVAYGELVRELGPEQVLYGIKARGVDGDQIPHSSIEEMATYYLELIKTVQPNGPYQLLGHSMGGLIVYEMARQLQHKGQEVGLVGLLDTYPPFTVQVKLRLPHIYNPFLQKQYVIMLDLFKGKKKPARTEDSVLYFDPVELWNLNEYEQQQFDYIYPKIREIDRLLSEASRKGGGNLESLKDRIVFSNSQPGEGSIEITKQVDENVPMLVQQESTKAVGFLQNLKAKAKRLIEPSKIQNYIWTKLPWLGYYMVDQKTHYLMTQFYRIDKHLPELKIIRLFEFIQIKVNGMIERAYKPQPYTGTVSFFISEEIPETNLQKDLRNWKKIIHGTTESYFVPGDHITLLEKPNVQVLAKKLLECMRESYTPSSDTNK